MAWSAPSGTDWSNPPPLILTGDTVTQLCRAAGWTGENLVTAIAVCQAESGFNAHARGVNRSTAKVHIAPGYEGSVDRGLFQINSKSHPEVTDDMAYDPATCVKEAHRIWKALGGTFSSSAGWSTARTLNGKPALYLKYVENARGLANAHAGDEVYQLPSVLDTVPTANIVDKEALRRTSLLGATGLLEEFEFIRLAFPGVRGESRMNVRDRVIGAPQLDLTMTEVSQLTVRIIDPGFRTLDAEQIEVGTIVNYAGMTFLVDGLGIGGDLVPFIELTCRAAGPMLMKKQTSVSVKTNLSFTQYAEQAARGVFMRFIGQGSPKKDQITRGGDIPLAGPLDPTKNLETEWDVLQRGAQELGYVCFESVGTLVFGKPSWLLTVAPRTHKVRYTEVPPSPNDLSFLWKIVPLRIPNLRRDRQAKVEGTLVIPNQHAIGMRVGDKLVFEGIGYFEADYTITQVNLTIDGVTPATIGIATLRDPKIAQLYSSSSATGDPVADLFGLDDSSGSDFSDISIDPHAAPPPLSLDQGSYGFPVQDHGITSYFGATKNRKHAHEGIDFASAGINGKPVYAAKGGVVIFAGNAGSYGNLVKIKHNDGRETRYAHLSRIVVMTADQYRAARANPKTTHLFPSEVQKGQLIGYVGTTGRSTGPHLHFEIREKGGTAVDPRKYLPRS